MLNYVEQIIGIMEWENRLTFFCLERVSELFHAVSLYSEAVHCHGDFPFLKR